MQAARSWTRRRAATPRSSSWAGLAVCVWRPARDLRRHGRLRPQARAVPRDGRGWTGGGVTGLYRRSVQLFGVISIGLGVALLAETAWKGGGVGFVFGGLFVALGAGR